MDNLRQMYKMQEGSEILNDDEITRSPFVNELIKVVKGLKSGSKTEEDLISNLDTLKDTIQALAITIDVLKDTQPASENFEAKFARMHELFELVVEEADNMALYKENQNESILDTSLEKIKEYIDEVLNISDEFKKVEDQQTVYSYSPEINDFIRVGHGYIKGDYALEPLRLRYDISKATLEETYTQMKAMETMPHDTKALEEEYPHIMAYLEDMEEQFNQIESFLASGDESNKESLAPAFDKIQEDSMAIFKIQVKIAEEIEKLIEEKKFRVCPRCSQKTLVSEKHCQHCKALMPPPPEGFTAPISDLNLVANEGGIMTGAQTTEIGDKKILSPNTLKMYEAAYKVGHKEITPEEFEQTIQWYEDIVNKTKTDLEAITPPDNLSSDEERVYNETHTMFEEAITESLDALAELRLFLKDEATDHLVNGVNALIEAGEKLHGVQIVGEIAEQKLNEENAENADAQ